MTRGATGHGVTGSGVTGAREVAEVTAGDRVTGARGAALHCPPPHHPPATLRLGPGFHISRAFGGGKVSHFMGFGECAAARPDPC